MIPVGSKKPFFLVKVSSFPGEQYGLQNEYENLRLLHRVERFAEIRSSIPRPICLETFEGNTLLVESFLPGRKFRDMYKGVFTKRYLYRAADWLINFHQKTSIWKGSNSSKTDMIKEKYNTLMEKTKMKFTLRKETWRFLDKTAEFLSDFENSEFPLVFAHNDFSVDNIFFTQRQIYITDWEYSQPEGLPFVDIFHFGLCYGAWHGKIKVNESLLETYSYAGKYFRQVMPLVREYLESIPVEEEMLISLVAIQLMRWALTTRIRSHEMINCLDLLAEGRTVFSQKS